MEAYQQYRKRLDAASRKHQHSIQVRLQRRSFLPTIPISPAVWLAG
jgi:hypothetical protein